MIMQHHNHLLDSRKSRQHESFKATNLELQQSLREHFPAMIFDEIFCMQMGGGYNYMVSVFIKIFYPVSLPIILKTYVMFDQVIWRGTSGQINRWRKNTLGLQPTGLDRLEPHKVPFLYNFSPHVVPPPLDWPEWIRITGMSNQILYRIIL